MPATFFFALEKLLRSSASLVYSEMKLSLGRRELACDPVATRDHADSWATLGDYSRAWIVEEQKEEDLNRALSLDRPRGVALM